MIKRGLAIILAVLFVFSFVPISVNAAALLDEIQDYTIKVHMRPDGTMDIRYRIEWKVLDDKSEGLLTWVKIGNPNKHVDEITAISDNIKEIGYMSSNGAYIRIDFDREYHAGELIVFEYTIHQSYMYIIEKDNHLCRYSFTPGWFEEIEVKNITIMWSAENVIESTAQKEEDGYLIWNSSLGRGERLNASVKYNLDTFATSENQQHTEDSGESDSAVTVLIVIGIIILVVIIIAFIIAIFGDDGYDSHGGFGGYRSSTYIHTHSSCVRSSCACVSSCACACACAGGGRAGCSKKDFYGTNLKTKEMEKVLKN